MPYFTAASAFKFVWNRRFLSLFKPISLKNKRRDSFLFRRLLIIIRLFRRFQPLQPFQVVNHRLEKLKTSLTLPFFGSASQSWDLFLDNFRRFFGIFDTLCYAWHKSHLFYKLFHIYSSQYLNSPDKTNTGFVFPITHSPLWLFSPSGG